MSLCRCTQGLCVTSELAKAAIQRGTSGELGPYVHCSWSQRARPREPDTDDLTSRNLHNTQLLLLTASMAVTPQLVFHFYRNRN